MIRKLFSSLLVFFLFFSSAIPQEPDLKQTFLEAESYFLFEEYNEALPLYLKIHRADPDNDNVNYKIGICLLNDPFQKENSISYLERASKNVNPKYKENNFKERTAPLETFYYLGDAYLVNNELEKAKENYKYFREILDEDIYDANLVDQQIRICERAGDLMQKPVDYDLINLGEVINSRFSDINPVLSGDRESLVYVSEMQFYDATFYARKVDGTWQAPRNIIPELGVDGDVYPTCLSYDGKTMIIYRNDDFIGNLYVSHLRDGIWTSMEKLGDEINTKYWESHGTLTKDGKTLYFTSNRKGGYGGLDIYKSDLQEDGTWGMPVNLGETINSRYNEETPFLTEDGNRIYFSSYGHFNMGGYDIFYSQANKNGEWGMPINLGYPINTTDDDLFFIPFNHGNSGLISKIDERGYGGFDIYHTEIYSENNPRLYLITGNFSTENGNVSPEDEIGIYVVDPIEGDTILIEMPDFETQTFDLKLPKGDFNLVINSKTYKEIIREISIDETTDNSGIDISGDLILEQKVYQPKLLTGDESRIDVEEDTITQVTPGEEYTLKLNLERNSNLYINVYYDSLHISSDTISISRRRFKYTLTPGKKETLVNLVMEEENGDRSETSVLLQADTTIVQETLDQSDQDTISQEQDSMVVKMEPEPEQDFGEGYNQEEEINEEEYEQVKTVINAYMKFAEGDLLKALSELDPVEEGIKTKEQLWEYLIQELGIEESDLTALELITDLDNSAEEMLSYMIDNSEGELNKYLQELDLEKLGIDSAVELIEHLKEVAGNEGFSPEDVFNIFGSIELDGLTVEMARKELLTVADGELKSYIRELDLQQKNIRSVTDLIQHLRDVSGAEAFTTEEVEDMVINESYYDIAAEDVLEDFISLSDGALKEYLQNIDLEKNNIITALDLINHLKEVGGEGSFTREEINELVSADMMAGLTAEEARNFFLSLGSDGLVDYLNDLDLEKEGIYTSAELINHLRRKAGKEAFTLQDIDNMISDQLVNEISAEDLKSYLIISGDKELQEYLIELDMEKEGITSATDLSTHLRKLAEQGYFKNDEINQLLLMEQYRDITSDDLRADLLEIASGELKEYLENIDLEELGIMSGTDLIKHLLEVSGEQPFSNLDICFLLTNITVRDMGVEDVKDLIISTADGELLNYIEKLDLKQKRITNPVALINHLREVSDKEGFQAGQINKAIAVASLRSLDAESAVKLLLDYTSGDLRNYIKQLDLQAKGIETGGELIDYLIEISRKQKFSVEDINNLIEKIHRNEFSVEKARIRLIEESKGDLKNFLTGINFEKEGINTKEDLVRYLISRAGKDFSGEDLYKVMPTLFGENRTPELFVKFLLSDAPSRLYKFLSQLDLEKEGIRTIDDLFSFLLQHADEIGMKQSSIIDYIMDSTAEFLSNPVGKDGIVLQKERGNNVLKAAGAIFFTGLLFIIILYLRREKENEKENIS